MRARRRPSPHDAAWHARQMARGPQGLVRTAWKVTTWSGQQALAIRLMAAWEVMPPAKRLAYAFPNQEDRERSIQQPSGRGRA